MTQPILPEGVYSINGKDDQAEVFYGSTPYTREIRVRWLPDDAEHQPLNALLGHVSVLELDHLVKAAAQGELFVLDPLEDLLPRPGWEIQTQTADNPSQYALRKLDTEDFYRGSRRELLLLLELGARSAIAPHDGQPPPVEWVKRLRDVHPEIIKALNGEALFKKVK